MTPTPQDSQRRLIPRWRNYYRTVRSGELAVRSSRKPLDEPNSTELAEKVTAFVQSPDPVTAVELISAATVFGGDSDIARQAKSVVSNASIAPAVKLLTERLATPYGPTGFLHRTDVSPKEGVRIMRGLLRGYERNPHLWTDLALSYTVQGQYRPAERAMRIALALAPHDRFVLRAASRFYVQIDKTDQAHALLLKNAATATDPWLIAAEISVAAKAGVTPRHVKPGRSLISSADYSNRDLTELNGALGTLELESGNRRAASKLFRQSLTDPSANALAQAAWAHYSLPGLNIEEALSKSREGWEAKALQNCEFGVWNDAVKECRQWVDDEPFSPRAANLGSFAASMSTDHAASKKFASEGLKKNPNNNALKNNLVVSLATLNEVEDAIQVFRTISQYDESPDGPGVQAATFGLIMFRAGEVDEGRSMYRRAIAWLESKNQHPSASRALAYLAREEIIARSDVAEATLKEASGRARTLSASERLIIDAVLAPAVKENFPEVQLSRPQPQIVLPPLLKAQFPNLVL